MPQLNAVTITTPSTSTEYAFNPRGINPQTGVAQLSCSQDSGSDLGSIDLTLFLNPSTRNRQTFKPRLKLARPTTVVETGSHGSTVETLARTALADMEFTFTTTSTKAERVEQLESIVELLKDPMIVDMVTNLNSVY